MEEIYEEVKKINCYEEFEFFIRDLYKRSKESIKDFENPECQSIMKVMEEIKDHFQNSKLKEIDFSQFRGI